MPSIRPGVWLPPSLSSTRPLRSGLQSYALEVAADNPIAWYRLGESSGTTIVAAVGSNGTYQGAPTLGVAGAVVNNTAVTFAAASTQRGDFGARWSALVNDWTLECWMKLANLTTIVSIAAYNGDNPGGYGFGISDGAGNAGLKLWGLFGSVSHLDSGYTFADTNWHHCVMKRESGTTKFFVDGGQTANTSASTPLTPTSTRANIAAQWDGANHIRYFNGSLDEVTMYNTPLNNGRILAHYNARNL